MADFTFAIPLARDDLLVRTERWELSIAGIYNVGSAQGPLCCRGHHSHPASQVQAAGEARSLSGSEYKSETLLQDCLVSVQQQGAAFITTGGFDVLFSLLQEYHNQATWIFDYYHDHVIEIMI